MSQGLTLSTFASGFPSSSSVGPLGIAFVPNGTVLVSDYPGNVRVFPNDTDGQNAAGAPVAQNYGGANAVDLAQLGGNIYMTRQGIGDLVQINNSGTFNQVIVTGMPAATGMVADPLNGALYVSTVGNGVIYKVDPIAKTKSAFVNASADGLTISGDDSTIYGEVGGHILGWNVISATQVFDSGLIAGGPDGAAVGAGLFAGELFVNTNSGQLFEINLATHAQTLIGTGGTRGDFVTVDTTNDTLLLTQTDRILRLTGASFSTPEPGYLVLLAVGLAAMAILRARRAGLPSTK
jgi:sugar lactone lactonase YvrE